VLRTLARRHQRLDRQVGHVSATIAELDELQPKLLALIPPRVANQ
jgi:prefoldin subunit 5